MSVLLRGISSRAAGSGTTISLTQDVPSLADGDQMLMVVYGNNVQATPPQPPQPDWVFVDGETSGTAYLQVWKRTAASEPASYTIDRNTGSKSYGAGIVAFYSDAAKGLYVDAHANQANASSTDRTCPGVTTTKTSAGLACFLQPNVNRGSVPPGDMTERWDELLASAIRVYAMTSILVASGATGDKVCTDVIASTSRCVTVAVAELEPPTAPTTLVATASAWDTIGLTWIDSAGETSYELDSSTNGSSWSLLATPAANATSYTDSTLAEHELRYYRLRGVNVDGNSAWTSTASATSLIKPPTSLTASPVSPTRIDLSWVENSSVETGIKIDRSPAGAGTWALIHTTTANVTSYADTSVSLDTAYDYRVYAYVGGDVSTFSNTATATTPLVAPTSLVATAVLSTKITLAWADAGTTEDGYKVERSPEGTSWSQIGTTAANVLTYEDISLAPATIFYYRVRSYHGANHSAYSGTANATTLAALVAPTSLAALVLSSTEISLSWVDSNAGVDGWSLERSLTGVGDWTVVYSPTSSPQVASGLVTGQTYWFRLRAQRTG